jgi:hypothetical protein
LKSASDTSAAAPPPTPLNAATICGMAVIFTIRAAGTATAVPTTMPRTISQIRCRPGHANVVPMATTMPPAPIRFPCRAHFGDDNPLSATMKLTPQARKISSITWARLMSSHLRRTADDRGP